MQERTLVKNIREFKPLDLPFPKVAESIISDIQQTKICSKNFDLKGNIAHNIVKNVIISSIYIALPQETAHLVIFTEEILNAKLHFLRSADTLCTQLKIVKCIQEKLFYVNLFFIFKSSCPEVICKTGILKNLAKFTGKHLCWRHCQ